MAGGPKDTSPTSGELDAEFDRFYREQAPKVRAFLLSRVRQPQIADDLLQEAFLRAYRFFPRFELRGIAAAESVWARRIAVNTWLNWYRGVKNEPVFTLDGDDDEPGLDVADPKVRDPARVLAEEEVRKALPRLLPQLPPEQRSVILLWLEGCSYEAICERTGKKMQNVKATLHKAKAKVRELYEDLHPPRPQGDEKP